MAYLLIILGAVLTYFGINKKIAADKPLGQMTGGEVAKAGFRGYLKIMMIAGGIALILMGIMIKVLFG